MTRKKSIEQNLDRILQAIRETSRCRSTDDNPVKLIAVSKRFPASDIAIAHQYGQRHFGENYAQELIEKVDELRDLEDIHWHFIGHLQTNKVKKLVERNVCIDSVDSLKLAKAIQKYASASNKTICILIQVNLANEPQKAGCLLEDLPELIAEIRNMKALNLQGLMMIPPASDDVEKTRPWFTKLAKLASQYQLEEVSMGMSQDFQIAIEEGSTMVRVGTDIFGKRPTP